MTARTGAGLLLAAAACAMLLGACDSGRDEEAATTAPVVQLGAPGGTNRVLTPDELEQVELPAHTDADVEFVRGMIHHHQQALVMTALVAERAASTELPLLAERMDVSQRDEIRQLEGWLEARGESVAADDTGHTGEHAELMPGMLTADELAQLGAADAATFDDLFLQYMIRHHEGAIAMVEQLLTAGFGGQEPEVFQLAQHIAADQSVEIARMKALLADA